MSKGLSLTIAALVFVCSFQLASASPAGDIYNPGDQVTLTGGGYFNPDCAGQSGEAWKVSNPHEYWVDCTSPNARVPSSGQGKVTPKWPWTSSTVNGTFRVCVGSFPFDRCGWYPPSSLRPTNAPYLPLIYRNDQPVKEPTPVSCFYRAVSGDTISGIANRFGFTTAELIRNNGQIINPDLLRIGDVLDVCRHSPG